MRKKELKGIESIDNRIKYYRKQKVWVVWVWVFEYKVWQDV